MDYYPEVLGKLFLVNCPYVFSGIWAIIKSWLDERIRKKVSIFSRDHYKLMSEYIDSDQIPEFLGGKNKDGFLDDNGPWSEYELIDNVEPGAVVGVRRKGDPSERIFTP